MAHRNDGKHVQEYVYDFAVDGGTNASAISLHDKARAAVIPVGAIITDVTAKIVTACTSAGSATVAWGNGDDADGYSGTTIAVATLVDNFLVNGHDLDAALLWDGTNDHKLYVTVLTAADGQFKLLISTADLTAGKIIFMVEYLLPTLT